jgi:manganese transport protein
MGALRFNAFTLELSEPALLRGGKEIPLRRQSLKVLAYLAGRPGEIVTNKEMLFVAMGILGATVMPHNLYLHSGIVQTRAYGDTLPEKREALKFATIDSTVALMFALLINASILILAAATFNKVGKTDVAELDQAHAFLAPLLGSAIAPTLFGIALLCCGLNSTVTATLSGQIVMEGFIDIRLSPWARRLVTRSIAIVLARFGLAFGRWRPASAATK